MSDSNGKMNAGSFEQVIDEDTDKLPIHGLEHIKKSPRIQKRIEYEESFMREKETAFLSNQGGTEEKEKEPTFKSSPNRLRIKKNAKSEDEGSDRESSPKNEKVSNVRSKTEMFNNFLKLDAPTQKNDNTIKLSPEKTPDHVEEPHKTSKNIFKRKKSFKSEDTKGKVALKNAFHKIKSDHNSKKMSDHAKSLDVQEYHKVMVSPAKNKPLMPKKNKPTIGKHKTGSAEDLNISENLFKPPLDLILKEKFTHHPSDKSKSDKDPSNAMNQEVKETPVILDQNGNDISRAETVEAMEVEPKSKPLGDIDFPKNIPRKHPDSVANRTKPYEAFEQRCDMPFSEAPQIQSDPVEVKEDTENPNKENEEKPMNILRSRPRPMRKKDLKTRSDNEKLKQNDLFSAPEDLEKHEETQEELEIIERLRKSPNAPKDSQERETSDEKKTFYKPENMVKIATPFGLRNPMMQNPNFLSELRSKQEKNKHVKSLVSDATEATAAVAAGEEIAVPAKEE